MNTAFIIMSLVMFLMAAESGYRYTKHKSKKYIVFALISIFLGILNILSVVLS